MEPIKMIATVGRVSTAMDGGAKVTFDVSEVEMVQAAKMMALNGKNVRISVELIEDQP